MSRPIWIDERPQHLGWLGLLLGLLALLVVALATTLWRDGSPRTRPAADPTLEGGAVAPPAVRPAPRAAGTDRTVLAAPAAPPAHCPYQRLDIAPDRGERLAACVAATRVTQSGDLRSYLLEPQGVSAWSLRIDSGDGVVMSARLLAPDGREFRCDEGACRGFAIGPRDAQGGRTLSIDGALLTAVADGRDAAAQRLSLGARLRVPGDQQDAGLACEGPHITLVERSGALLALCASGGGGMVLAEDGRRVFSLRGPAGDTLLVGVDAAGTVDQVELGALACRGASACSGASTWPGGEPGSDAGRVFSFSGTTLTDGSPRPGGPAATLNGSAVLPAF